MVHGISFVSMCAVTRGWEITFSCRFSLACPYLPASVSNTMDENISIVPSTPKKTHLTHDQRHDVQLLRSLGWSYPKIAKHVDATERQVQYACQGPATPQKCSGRPLKLNSSQIEELIKFITASRIGRQMSYLQLVKILDFSCGEHAIRSTLKKKGFNQCVVRQKPLISAKNQQLRLA